jgi:DNA-directed RNA polymerase subunit RPC12/RpoP
MKKNLQEIKKFRKSTLIIDSKDKIYKYSTIYGYEMECKFRTKRQEAEEPIYLNRMCACYDTHNRIYLSPFSFICLNCGRLYEYCPKAGTLVEWVTYDEGKYNSRMWLFNTDKKRYDRYRFIVDSTIKKIENMEEYINKTQKENPYFLSEYEAKNSKIAGNTASEDVSTFKCVNCGKVLENDYSKDIIECDCGEKYVKNSWGY